MYLEEAQGGNKLATLTAYQEQMAQFIHQNVSLGTLDHSVNLAKWDISNQNTPMANVKNVKMHHISQIILTLPRNSLIVNTNATIYLKDVRKIQIV